MGALTVFLVKEEITDPHEIVRGADKRPVVPVRHGRRFIGNLYIEPSRVTAAKWVSYFKGSSGEDELAELNLLSASASGVLLAKGQSRLFAVVFGYGRHLLEDGVVESRFGLRVTLNTVAPDSLRSIDHKRLDAVPRLTREQLSKAAGMEQFGLNIERDMLRALTGRPTDPTLGSLLCGADQLSVTGKVPLETLTTQLDRYLTESRRRAYRDEFSWVDNIREVSDKTLRSELDEHLLGLLGSEEEEAVWLAVPDILDWKTLAGFQYSRSKASAVFEDLELADYFTERHGSRTVTIEELRHDRVWLVDAETDSSGASWSIYNCLIAELAVGKKRYVLNEGRWYSILPEFLDAVTQAIGKIPQTAAPLPFAKSGETEPGYTKRVFQQGGTAFAHLDNKHIKYPGRAKVEVCDLYWANKAFIHVKRYGASSKLSHLFSQGTVSAQLFQLEPRFRDEFLKKLPPTHHWAKNAAEPVRTQDFEIAYAIMKKGTKPLSLPFFSKVNLKNAVALLQASGYKVTLTAVHTK